MEFRGGVEACERFDEACERAEAVRDRAVEKATTERDQIVRSISGGRIKPSERLKAALEARCAGRLTAAEEQHGASYRSAEQELFQALDQLEGRA